VFLNEFSYIAIPEKTGLLAEDAANLLLINQCPKTLEHVRKVSEVCVQLADRFGIDRSGCMIAGLLHDISAVIHRSDMLAYAQNRSLSLCEAEMRLPFLLHQRLSRIVAQEYFAIADEEVLGAIECHTTLKAHASGMDMALFIADKLAWDQEGVPPFYDEVYALLPDLPSACLAYMDHMQDTGRLLYPHTRWTEAYRYLTEKKGR